MKPRRRIPWGLVVLTFGVLLTFGLIAVTGGAINDLFGHLTDALDGTRR